MMDSRKKKILVVLSCGCLLLVWRVYVILANYLPSSARGGETVEVLEPEPGAANATAQNHDNDVLRTQRRLAARPWLRDPFHLPDSSAEQTIKAVGQKAPVAAPDVPHPRFSGVVRSKGQMEAVVDGYSVRMGDRLSGGVKVVEINRNTLTLESNGWLFTYELGSSDPIMKRRSEVP